MRALKNKQLGGAMFYYLRFIVGYSEKDVDPIWNDRDSIEWWQIEELALLGYKHRHKYPKPWNRLIN